MGKLLLLPAILIALSFHEFAHGKAADLLGDPTPGEQGRLTLNPLPHIDWIGFLMLMFFSFGWAKPVLVSPWKFTREITMKTGMMIVALAGPAMNLLLAIIAAIGLAIALNFLQLDARFDGLNVMSITILYMQNRLQFASPVDAAVFAMIFYLLWINIILMLFNLIPVPPLDGSKILAGLLPDSGGKWIYMLDKYGMILLIVLIFSGVLGFIRSMALNIMNVLLALVSLF